MNISLLRIIITEAYSPIEILIQYYGNATRRGDHLPFSFRLVHCDTNNLVLFI